MLSQTNNRTHGRFIKKSDPIRKIMNVSDFNLLEICERPPTFHDNPNANVIHNKLHSEEELAEGVRNSHEIDVAFPHEYRPVIRPLDFTEEWKKQRKRQANRQQRFEDEEEYELDMANVAKKKKYDLKNAKYTEIETSPEVASPEPEKYSQTFETQNPKQSEFAKEAELARPLNKNLDSKVSAKAAAQNESMSLEIEQAEGFVPYYASRNSAMVENPMAVTSLEPARLSDEELEKLRSEAKAEGYRQGFEIGEEKGALSIQSKVDAIHSEIANIINELQGMQKSVLNKAQENFLVVCQSLVESLLHREFKINPESFGNVIEKAIAETLPDENFTIFVNAETFAALSSWSNNELKKLLKIDPKIEADSFRVEGQHAVVDGNLSKIIGSLLEQADIELFEEQKGVG